MYKKDKKVDGITLIVLVITVIVLLILAGVTINALSGDNGILTKAVEAKKETELASEKEAMQTQFLLSQMDEDIQNIGVELYDKNIENGNKWNIIYVAKTDKKYGTGWYYIPRGTEISEYGKCKQNWIVNYKTGEFISLEDNEYTNLNYNENLAVKDNLIFNLDSTMIENGSKESIQEQLGNNVELINFNWDENSGITRKSFNFDGVDDYIKIKYDDSEQKKILAESGYTFEFYGILDKGKAWDSNNNPIEDASYTGIFCYGKDNDDSPPFRFGIETSKYWLSLKWNAGFGKYESDFSESNDSPHNIHYKNVYGPNEVVYYTVTLDCTQNYSNTETNYYRAKCYKNGKKVYEGKYNKNSWKGFIDDNLSELKYFNIGRAHMKKPGCWYYTKMNTYTLRLYNRGLTEEEVNDNYEKTVGYYNSILK